MSGEARNLLFDEDELFDLQLPPRMRLKSSIHFTPVTVARLAARMLAPRPGMRVLDVGSGPGKFCIVAAREVPSATFVGVEIRPHLVRIARRLASRAGLENAAFIEGNAMDTDWRAFDAFYLYNPFAEQLRDDEHVLDRSMTFAPAKFAEYVRGARERLSAAPAGTRVVTYHSFGAPAPLGYELVEDLPIETDRLELWVKSGQRSNHERGAMS
ncbi:MAG: methyltransferase domain-containing protein [Myxococcales bacterium]|nr:methyltransferase domain-containing protein [Myxococcales bacterium]